MTKMEATQAVKTLKNYINGEWQAPSSDRVEDVINPATGEVIGKIAFSTKEDTERAIDAARQAFDSGVWADATTHERAAVLLKIADLIEAEAEELAI